MHAHDKQPERIHQSWYGPRRARLRKEPSQDHREDVRPFSSEAGEVSTNVLVLLLIVAAVAAYLANKYGWI